MSVSRVSRVYLLTVQVFLVYLSVVGFGFGFGEAQSFSLDWSRLSEALSE